MDQALVEACSTRRPSLCASPTRGRAGESCGILPESPLADELTTRTPQVTAVSIGFAGHLAFVLSKWLVKKGLSRIEDLVQDFDSDDPRERGVAREKVD